MNPSTEDILESVNKVPAKTVFVFPNNKNIIMAAEQVDELTEKTVKVIPSKTIPQGITAILSFNPDGTADENKEAMTEAMTTVKSGSVTFAARDSDFDGMEIKEGDIMAMEEGKITKICENPDEAVMHILGNMTDEFSSVISVYYGEDIKEEEAAELEKKISDTYGECDIIVNNGGQPLYYYIVSVE